MEAGRRGAWRDDIALLSQIVGIVGGPILVAIALTNFLTGLSAEGRMYAIIAGLLILGYGGTYGLYRAVKWARARTAPPIIGLDKLLDSVRLYPLVLGLQEIGHNLKTVMDFGPPESLLYVMSRAPPPASIRTLFENTVKEKVQPVFARLRGLGIETTDPDEIGAVARELVRVAEIYGTFIDEYQKNVTPVTEEQKENLRLCLDAYNHIARRFQSLLPELERSLGREHFQTLYVFVKEWGIL